MTMIDIVGFLCRMATSLNDKRFRRETTLMNSHQLRLRLITVIATLVAISAQAAPFGTIDQRSPGPGNGVFDNYNFLGDGLTQGFTPTLSGIDAVELSIRASGTSNSLRIDLFSGDGDGGTLLGSSATLNITNQTFATLHFDFPSRVPLSPGALYSFRITHLGGDFSAYVEERNFNPYPGGIPRNPDGSALPFYDLIFTEGLTIPEPASASIMGLGLLAIGYRHRRKRS